MADFSAGAVIGMLGLVETTVIALFLHLDDKTADQSRVDDVEELAEEAIEKARGNQQEIARAHRRVNNRGQ